MNRRAFVLGAAMVLLCNLVAVTMRSFAEAAFLEAYGASKLPWLLIANAGGFAVATLGYDVVSRRVGTRVLDLVLLVALLISSAAGPALLDAGASPVVLVVALSATSQVAGLALWNRVALSVAGRDARRMLPRAGAAVTLGGVVAGLGAGALVFRTGLPSLAYVGAAVTAVVLGLCVVQEKALASGGSPGAAAPAGTSDALGPLQRRLLAVMIVVALLEGVIATVIDLQFMGQLKQRYSGDTLAAAIALFYGATNGVLFLLQVSAVPRILVTRSLPTTAAIHPVMAIAWYAVFTAAPTFIAIAGTRTADQVLRAATSRTSQEIELSAFPPVPRGRWKVLLRGGLFPLGSAIAAFVLLQIGPAAVAHPTRLAAAAVGVAVLWAIAAQIGARRFQAALAAPLGIRAHRAEDLHTIDLDTLEKWSHVAGGEDAREAALARAALARAKVRASDLADHLRHDEPAVRTALFDQLARSPAPELKGELRAAVEIEDDDRALAAGLEALAIAGDDSLLERGRSRADLSREVAEAVRSAEITLKGGDVAGEVARLCERDPEWAVALIRRRRTELPDEVLSDLLSTAASSDDPPRHAGALSVIARVGPDATLPILMAALEAGEPAATAAIVALDPGGAKHLTAWIPEMSPLAKIAIARALSGAPEGSALVGALLGGNDPEVAHAALRTALAIARGGGELPAGPVAAANRVSLQALVLHLDARDASADWSACAKQELDIATRRCVARVLWAAAVEAAAAGRDPAALAAAARHLVGGREADRRRALDVVQEVQAGRSEILAVIERWLRPPVPTPGSAVVLGPVDLWLAKLCTGQLAELEPTLLALRKPALFASLAGPALAVLATQATRRTVSGTVFEAGTDGESMFVVIAGVLEAVRPGAPPRTIAVGSVVGEVAVLTRARRAATVTAPGPAEVLEIHRDTFAAVAQRAPELVAGLSATLAGWIAPERPDVLGG
ncbi:MAG: cyclic nucleotide-binding domain-containing protein [Myxococcales bacterium]|nr:cyclic nucleotide-binding domain-containing protein [Myxococcales bacterium]